MKVFFKDRLKKVDGDNIKLRYIVCQKTLCLSSAGRSAVTDQADESTHKEILNKKKTFFEPKLRV